MMQSKRTRIGLAIAVACVLTLSCDESNAPGEFPKTLLFTSFEGESDPSLQTWNLGIEEDSVSFPGQTRLTFVSDTPPGGGEQALELVSSPWQGKYAGKFIFNDNVHLPPGSHQYRFSLWAKLVTGSALAGVNHVDTTGGAFFSVSRIRFDVSDTAWKQFSGTATLSDSSHIMIFAGTVTVSGNLLVDSARTVRVDLLKLERLD